MLMVNLLNSTSSCPGLNRLAREIANCVHGQDTVLSQCLPPPRCINGYLQIVEVTWQSGGARVPRYGLR